MSLDRQELKIQALRERLSSDKAKYEDEIANLRVDLTVLDYETKARIAELEQENAVLKSQVEQQTEVVSGEVVDVQEEE